MKRPLIAKLLAINLAVIAIVILCVWLAVDYLAAGYFSTLMERYHISPTETHGMFVASVHRYLIGASLVALVVATALSYLLTRRVLRPLSEMSVVIATLAAGDYSARVSPRGNDEIARLGTAFNRMADSLQRLEELRHNMVVDVAHELRTPLTSVRGYLEAVQDGVMVPDGDTIALLHSEVLRLIHLVEDLQRLARADAASGHLQRVTVDIGELLDQLLRLYRPQFDARHIRIRTVLDPAARHATADPDKLMQIISNLLQNACRHAVHGSTVRICVQGAGAGSVRLEVQNTGVRIPERELPLIFERFYRPDKSRSRDSGGAGIGLAIVRQLVAAHGGEVGADNTDDGVRVWFTLPA